MCVFVFVSECLSLYGRGNNDGDTDSLKGNAEKSRSRIMEGFHLDRVLPGERDANKPTLHTLFLRASRLARMIGSLFVDKDVIET